MANISKIKLPDGTEYNIRDATPSIVYCTSSTAAGTAAKTTTIVSGTFVEADLVAGAQVLVKFTNSNSVASPTLKIGDTTAKAIRRYGTTAPSTSAASAWNAGAIVLFVYDGTYWFMEGWLNTTYSSMTEAEITAGTGTTARLITPARLKLAIETWETPVVDGTTTTKGIVKLNTSTNSTSTTEAATPSAVKSAYDLADSANTTAGTALSGVNGTLIYDHTYSISNGVATFTPHVYLKGSEVTTDYASSCFGWKYRLIDGTEVTLTTKSDRGCDVTISNMGYGGHVIGTFTPA